MMKMFGRILLGLLALIILLVSGVAIYVTTQFDPNDYRAVIAEKVSDQMGRKVEIHGPLEFAIFPSIKLALHDVTMADADWTNSKQPMMDIKQIDAAVALMPLLQKQVVVEGITLNGATINLTKNTDRANWEFRKAEPAAQAIGNKNDKTTAQSAQPVSLEVLALNLSDTTVNYKDGEKTTSILIKNAKTSLRPTEPLEFVADGEINRAPIKINIKGDRLQTLLSGGENFPLKGNIEIATATISFDGAIKNPQNFGGADFNVSAGGNGKDLGAITGNPLPFGNFDLKTHLVMPDANTANLDDLNFSTGQTKAIGALKISLEGKVNVQGELNIPSLHLADFSDSQPATATPELEKKQQSSLFISHAYAAAGDPLIPAIPLPGGDALGAVNANVKLVIGEIIQGGKPLASFDGTAALTDGNLHISPMKLGYAKNIFTGSMNLDGRGETPAMTLNLNSDNLNYGELLKELNLNDRISGTGAMALSLSGSGKDLRAALGGSRGSFKFTSNEGQFDTGILFGKIGSLIQMATPNYDLPNVAHLRCANFAFTGQNGIWQTTGSAADSDVLALQLSGEVNLATEKLNFKTFPIIKAVKTGGLIPPIKFSGDITNPSAIVDGNGLAQSAVTGAVLGKTKGIDILRSLGTAGEATPTSNSAGNSCLAAVQASVASSTPEKSTGSQARDLLNKSIAPEKQEKLKENLREGLKGLFGK